MKQGCHPLWGICGIALFCLSLTNPTRAQIVPDGTLPVNSIASPQGDTTLITGGTVADSNLFHSFQQFSIPTGSTAFFNNGSAVQNIISRVTGESISNIDGLIRANGTANLFLLNPNGIIFGSNARLNIGGSVFASTASSLNFADGTSFSATSPQSPPLLTVSVPIGLQFGGTAARILVFGSGNNLSVDPTTRAFVRGENPASLQVQPDKTLALVGGEVTLEGGNLIAEGGGIELGSVAAPSIVNLTPTDFGWTLGYEDVRNFGDIQLSQRASVDASGSGGGNIHVQGAHVTLTDGSAIFAITQGSKPGRTMDLNASDSLEVIGTSADGQFPSALFTDTAGAGAAGDLTINTRQLSVRNGAAVTADTLGSGDAGSLTVNASDSIQLIGISADRQFASGLFAETSGDGAAGDLTITTGQLLVQDGAFVSASTNGSGKAGTLTVTASNSVELSATTEDAQAISGLFAETYGDGAAGDLTITTGQLLIQDGAQVSASTYGSGKAGTLAVNASNSVELSGTTEDGQFPSGLFAQVVGEDSAGVGGNLTITTGQLLIQNGAQVSASTFGTGKAGALAVSASDSVKLIGESVNGGASGLFTSVQNSATGDGGNLTLETQRLSIRDGAQIAASTLGRGSAGTLTVIASESIELSGTSIDDVQRPSLTARTTGAGNAGNLRIETEQLTLRDRAKVTVSSEGSGNAGTLEVAARSIRLDNLASLSSDTTAGQGNIELHSQDLVLRRESFITTNATGTATGGNISIDTDNLVALENSDISADAPVGSGGQIIIDAQGIFGTEPRNALTPESDITASGAISGGTISINNPDIDPSQGLVILPAELVDASNSIAQGCSAGVRSGETKFVITGRGGLPPNPNEPLTGDNVLTDWNTLDSDTENRFDVENRSGAEEGATNPTKESANTQIVEANGWMTNDLGEVVLTATAPTASIDIPWLPNSECNAPESES